MSESNICGATWWGDWIQSAKDKSVTTLNIVKHDLAEFTSTMHHDSLKIATNLKEKLSQENASSATEAVKQGVSSLIGGISKALNEDESTEKSLNVQTTSTSDEIVFDRAKARLHAIQVDQATYTSKPMPEERFQEWLMSNFDMENMKGVISELLVSNFDIRALYTQLVPVSVSNFDFWSRFFFKCYLLEEEEARRVELMKRVDGDHRDIGWDEDDEDYEDARRNGNAGVPTNGKINSTLESDSNSESKHFETVNSMTNPVESKECFPVISSARKISESESSAKCANEGANTDNNKLEETSNEIPESLNVLMTTDHHSMASSSEMSLGEWSAVSDARSAEEEFVRMKMQDGLGVTGPTPDRATPDSSSNTKESLDDDWEKDFDVDITEEELQMARKAAQRTSSKLSGNTSKNECDWEDW